jgi:CSLREA domain-containing protein
MRGMKTKALVVVLAVGLVAAPAARAATISVNTTADELDNDGNCSLREAVRAANSDAVADSCAKGNGADTIKLRAGLYRFSSALGTTGENGGLQGDLDITAPLTIKGAGATATVVDANQLDRVFEVRPGVPATLSRLTIENGKPPAGSDGGGALIDSGATLGLVADLVSSNQAESGAGVRVGDGGALSTSGSAVIGNSATAAGGGIAHIGTTATLKNTIVAGNSANHGGGITNGIEDVTSTMSIAGGAISGNQATASGGGIDTLKKLSLTGAEISGNQAGGSGGGLFIEIHAPPVTLTRATVSRNTTVSGVGGGIDNESVLTVADSTVSGNRGGDNGGGISSTGTLTVNRSTLSDNFGFDGDGLNNYGDATLTNTTLSGNGSISPGGRGGGIFNASGDSLTLRNDTIYQNIASAQAGDGGNLYKEGPVSAKDTIVANALTSGNCGGLGTITSLGRNLDYDSGGDIHPCFVPPDLNGDPALGSLKDNGGPTRTHALGTLSAALNAGAGCEPTDQRGVPRPQGSACEIGAYERATCRGAVVNRVGTPGSDLMTGTNAADVFLALGGNDVITGGGGGDRICAGPGNDRLTGGAGRDKLSGQSGNDQLFSRGDGARDVDSCGSGGGDAVTADPTDSRSGCEIVH